MESSLNRDGYNGDGDIIRKSDVKEISTDLIMEQRNKTKRK